MRRRDAASAGDAVETDHRRKQPVRRPLPEHLPREPVEHHAGVRLPGLRRRAAPDRRGRRRDARVRAGALQGDPARAPEARLRRVRAHRAGGGAVAADRARACRARAARPRSGGQVLPITCRCIGRRRSTPAKGVELERSTWPTGSAGCFRLLEPLVEALGALRRWRPRSCTPTTPGAGARARTRHDQDRAGCGPMCAMIARRQHRAAGGAVPLLAGSQGRAPASST